jgi:guanylate kinase
MKKYPVIVVSAPSGAGKTTLNTMLVKEVDELEISVSHTTRKPRAGEAHGVHYHYIEEQEFRSKIEQGDFIEWAHVHTSYYGTSFGELERIRAKGHIPILEIDVQGWMKVRSRIQNALSIFIAPPSLKILWDRLEGRQSENIAQRWVRFKNAIKEIEFSKEYQIVIVNDDLSRAYQELKSCILGDDKDFSQITRHNREHCEKLLKEFEDAEWIQELYIKAEQFARV